MEQRSRESANFSLPGGQSTDTRDLQIRLRLRVRVRLLNARGLGFSCRRHCCCRRQLATKIESFRFDDEDEDEDEDEAFCFRQNEIFKIFRLQLGREDEVDSTTLSRHHCHGFEDAYNEQKLPLVFVLVLVLVFVLQSKAR